MAFPAARILPVLGVLIAGVSSPAQATIELTDVPKELVYPVAAGSNPVITAIVRGEAVEAVWLAVRPDARDRLPLVAVDAGRYQVNLASAAVIVVLRASGSSGQFAIHARTRGGATVSSVSIRYAFLRPSPRWAELAVFSESGPASGHPSLLGRRWYDADEVTRIEWRFGRVDDLLPVAAVAGDERWSFTIDEGQRLAHLDVTDARRKSWRKHGELQVLVDVETSYVLRDRPRRLDLDGDSAELTIMQRERAKLPGSRGYLTVSLGDITWGQVLLTVLNAEGEAIVPRRSVRKGQAVRFTFGEADYVLTIDRLFNVLIGDDFAELTIEKLGSWERDRIAVLLARMEAAELVFIRNGERYTQQEAAEHLRRKYEAERANIPNVERFIEDIASRSSTTGKPYLVELPDGQTIRAATWLRDEVKEPDAAAEGRQARKTEARQPEGKKGR